MVYTHVIGLWMLVAGFAVLCPPAGCLRGSALVAELKAKAKAALLNPTETVEEVEVVTVEGELAGNATNITVSKTKSLLTGDPQKDYIYDPNLPRELNGYNLTNYPFYNSVPKDIDFKCDDLHDGFYASVPHKCQVYHHCLFGTRYDFLCANYTAFDQRTFICHFVSEVDCDNSPKFYQRNEALYKAASTAAPIVLMTTPPAPALPPSPPAASLATQRPRRRRPYRRRRPRPVYEYYYDDQYDDEEYYDDDPPPPRRKANRKHRPQGGYREEEEDYYDGRRDSSRGESSRNDNSRESSRGENSRSEGSRGDGGSESPKPTLRVSGPASGTVYDRPRIPPKIRRPVPINERDKYDYTQKTSDSGPPPTQDPKKNSKSQTKPEEDEDEYYDEEYDEDYVKPPPKRSKASGDYSTESGSKIDSRRPNSRHRQRQQSRRRPDRYEDDYEEERPVRPRKRPRHEDPPQMSRGNRGGHRGYSRDEPDPVPADRPGFISSGRFSSSSRKRPDDERSQGLNKKSPSRIVYDDDEEEEYYDDEEEDTREEEVIRRSHKSSGSSGSKGRRNDDYVLESGRKPTSANRKTSGDTYSSKPISKNDERSQVSGGYQGDYIRSEKEKFSNRQKPEATSFSRGGPEKKCKNECEDEDYSEEIVDDSKQEKRKDSERETQRQTNDRDNQKQINERDRLFSSRFRETGNDSKTKQQTYDSTSLSKPSSSQQNHRTTTQNPEVPQKHKPVSRIKSGTDDLPVAPKLTITTTTTAPPEEIADESIASGSKFSNFRSKGRVGPPTPLINNYKAAQTTDQQYETGKGSDGNQGSEAEVINSGNFSSDKQFIPPRPFSGVVRRPAKPTTEPAPSDEFSVTPKTSSVGFNYRQPAVTNEDDEKSVRKPINSGQNYRRVKVDSSQVESSENNQSKTSNIGSNFRRPNKPVEDTKPEDVPPVRVNQEEAQSTVDGLGKGGKPSILDKPQLGISSYGGAYRRVKVSTVSTVAPEAEVSTSSYENPQAAQDSSMTNSGNSYKRPFLVARPLSNFPVVVEDTTKNVLSLNGPVRRPIKQRIQDTETPIAVDEYNPSSATVENYSKGETNLGVNLRTNLGFFAPKRGKIRIDENSARGLEPFPKQLNLNQEDQFSKQSPKIEITAPGPSAPDSDIATVKSNYKNEYNSAPPGFTLDIPEEEYDVTLNDALQPSTLHPTRSLVDYQQARLKTRDFQSRSPEYVNRGRVSYLLPAASQQYITRVQSIYAQEKQEESPVASGYSNKSDNKKGPSFDQDEYEAVVLTAPSNQWPTQRRSRPTEWYW